ncbi:MAG: hypothetical protein KAR83_06405 [Thermodesulfovibrionales bacterium]|nr:hypothetical protein [Thermodesulfovibrionales bacterium]
MSARRARKAMETLFSGRVMFWLIWCWVLLYVTLAVWGEEAFASFVHAHSRYPLVFIISCFSILVFAGNLARYVLRGFRTRGMLIIPWLILPAGVLIFLAGFVAMAGYGKSKLMVLQEGQEFRLPASSQPYVVESLDVDVLDTYFEADQGFGILRSEPNVMLARGGVRHRVGAFPPASFDGVYSNILDFGIAPGMVLLERGRIVLRGNSNMRILPPGTQDFFEIEGLPYRIYLRIAPDRIVERAGEKIKLYDLASPKYFVRVEHGDETVFDGTSDQEILFKEYQLRFEPYVYWVWLEFKKGIGIPLVWAGSALIALGLPITLLLMAGRAIKHVHLHAGD